MNCTNSLLYLLYSSRPKAVGVQQCSFYNTNKKCLNIFNDGKFIWNKRMSSQKINKNILSFRNCSKYIGDCSPLLFNIHYLLKNIRSVGRPISKNIYIFSNFRLVVYKYCPAIREWVQTCPRTPCHTLLIIHHFRHH